MAAYAALVSLMNTLDNVQAQHRFSNSIDKKQVKKLREKLDFLLDFVETNTCHHSELISDEAEAQLVLEREIACAAFAAEDVIESHIVHHINLGSEKGHMSTISSHIAHQISSPYYWKLTNFLQLLISPGCISLLNLHPVMQNMDSLKEKVIIINGNKEKRGLFGDVPTHPTSSSTSSSTAKISRMVGLDDELIRLLDELTGNHQSSLQIIPIVGMGGIGKTTLAINAYENLLIVQHFDIRAWVTVSQQYTVRDIFSKLISCIYSDGEFDRETETQLEERLYKSLIGRRYLIILDDIWSIEAWDAIKRFFPNNNNTSRVVVTTRLSNIATQLGSTSSFQLGFLDEDLSWELFCEHAFPRDGCPPDQLQEIGKKIVRKCKGLPLLIVVIGALLKKSSSYVEYWERVSENIHSILTSGEEESLDILSLSYNHLPAHLKPCFLYMATFPEDYIIQVSILIKLWVAEGFVKPSKTQSLEEVAKSYLKDLSDRNLILKREERWETEYEFCSIHDLLRDLCLEKARKENFLCVMRVGDIRQGIDTESCFVFNQGRALKPSYIPEDLNIVESAFLARSSASSGDSKFKMLRVLNAPDSNYGVDYMSKQVNLRYISIQLWSMSERVSDHIHPSTPLLRISERVSDHTHPSIERVSDHIHPSISLLWNLQTLIICDVWHNIVAPCGIWEIPQLRHVEVTKSIWLPDRKLSKRQDGEFVMPNLQTLERVLNLTDEACKRIPNVKRLWVIYARERVTRTASYDFGCLHKLESLYCEVDEKQPPLTRGDLLRNLTFPSSLQELYLKCSGDLHWEDLTMIGSLPHLQLLKLQNNSVMGSEWNPVEGEFLRLRFLEICSCDDLINWNAHNSHFPVLEKLVLEGMPNLNEIPLGLGEIATLGEIKLYECSESSSISAVKILDDQESYGNEGLRVRIGFWKREELERFKEKIEQFESSTSTNLEFRRSR